MQVILMLLLCVQPPQIFTATGTYVKEVAKPAAVDAPRTGKRYLAMFTASYCRPCQQWKLHQKLRVEAAGYSVMEYEMTVLANAQKYGERVPRYPGFAVVDWDTGEWLSELALGDISAETAIAMLERASAVSPPVTTPVVTQPPTATTTTTAPAIMSPPTRYIHWPGWSKPVDLETYARDCECPMCVGIRAMQVTYWRDLKAYQAATAASTISVPADQQGCPAATIEAMLDAMKLTADDTLADWGCGDGRILIAAARRGIHGIGVEIDPARAAVAVQAVKDAGLSHLIKIETGDALNFDTTRVTAVTAFLYPELLAKLAPKMMQVRVAASPYHPVPGLDMSQVGEIWIYERPVAD